MEAFSLLRYWRTNAVDATKNDNDNLTTPTATTIVTAVSSQTSDTEDDHGPFFDLEFTLPVNEIGVKNYEETEEEEDSDGSDESEEDDDDESELKLTSLFPSGSSGDSTGVSVSDDVFGFLPVEQTEEIIKSNPPQSRATRLRVMILKLKKSKLKTNVSVDNEDCDKSMAKAEENIPNVSLFKSSKQKKQQNENETVSVSSDEKKFTKKAMREYLRKVKPLYVRVSKRYGEKLKLTGQLSLPVIKTPNSVQSQSPETEEKKQFQEAKPKRENESNSNVSEPPLLQSGVLGLKQGNLPAGIRVVCKHLRKSRSAITAAPPGAISSNRRDDSLIQQQDGIQSAILHCKRSFKASRDSDCSSSSASEPASSQDGKCENGSNSEAADGKETPEMNKS